jgi:acyl-CoA oxidase
MQMGQTMGGYPGFGLFVLTISGQSSMEQLGWWLPPAYKLSITGAYAQTELGHGSNVRGLRTTATYDKKTQEFVLDTPSLAATKWWPSSMATATHAVVYAQLLIDGHEYGVHVFWVQLRDENLEPLVGIEVGDIGTKMGENEVDIGYLRLKNCRIPRKHMMEKKQHVTPDGRYVKHTNKAKGASSGPDKSAYLTMMGARVSMVGGAAAALAKAATIAIRYNIVRKQGFKDTAAGVSYKTDEMQIIDYKMNQYRLLKELSLAYAIRFTSNWMNVKMDNLRKNADADASDLPETHASAAGLKGFCCNAAAVGIEELRKCCGGAGYLLASGIAALEADYKWRATAEGDTVVMLLQTARYLVKAANSAKNGEPVVGLTACLAPLSDPKFDPLTNNVNKPPVGTSIDQFMDINYLLSLFEYRAVAQVYYLATAMWTRQANGESFDSAWAALTLKACRTGQTHVMYFMMSKFVEMVATCEDDACKAAISKVCALFALSDLVSGQQWNGLLDISQTELAEAACNEVCSQIRPDALALVDAWDFPDAALNSTIGGYDGNIYEAQYKAAVSSPLNQKRIPGFFEKIKPYLDLNVLSFRNKTDPSYTGQDNYPEGEETAPASSKAKL